MLLFSAIKPWIWIRICVDLKCWIRIYIATNSDPKHCLGARIIKTKQCLVMGQNAAKTTGITR
jgi:hypothetical protein